MSRVNVGALWLAILALVGPAQLKGISVGQFGAMHVHLILFAAFLGALAYAVGAATGRKSLAIGLGVGLAVLGYIANGIIPQSEGLGWVRNLSPFQWLNGDHPLRSGVQGRRRPPHARARGGPSGSRHVGLQPPRRSCVTVQLAVGRNGGNEIDAMLAG